MSENVATARMQEIEYDDQVVRAFILASLIFGVVALLLGVIIAAQISFWQMNFGTSWLTFGRLRPLHTNAAIFAFVGNMMFAGVYHSSQRLLKTRLASDTLSWIHFWGWQLIIVCAAITLPLGLTQSKEYAELIWPIDLLVALIWVVFAVNYFWTLAKRNEKNIYVAIWFYIATVVTIPVLYIVNNLQLPTSLTHSYGIFAGVQDALVQWWYGHNAVGFFLTTPILGIMYYYLPKAAGRPVYSYRLSIVHFWALIFVYIWAGPHHLLYTALPDWAQSLGMLFSIMLWAPSWGGMLNGLLTLRGAWDKLRTDPVIKFLIAGVTFYGMSTFEGPLLSIKSVSALAHYTDWIIGHVHGGALGWNGFMAAGMFYWLVPRLWNTKLFSTKLADAHFWLGTLGILMYMGAMWVSGVNQGLYWRALDADGFLKYPDFIEAVASSRILWHMRLAGGLLYLVGFLLMGVNLLVTIRSGAPYRSRVLVPVLLPAPSISVWALVRGWPVVLSALVIAIAIGFGLAGPITSPIFLSAGVALTVGSILVGGAHRRVEGGWHRLLEGRPLAFTVLSLFAILIGGIAELVPTIATQYEAPVVAAVADSTVVPASNLTPAPGAAAPASGAIGVPGGSPSTVSASPAGAPTLVTTATVSSVEARFLQEPYSPLELEGRDIYVRDGCYLCHSQMIRPFRHETLRYGEYSRAGEFRYDRPFLWGSKRTGPDLHREGGKYPNLWHYQHLMDPRSTSPASNMPMYNWMKTQHVDLNKTRGKLIALKKLGVPYSDEMIDQAVRLARSQGELIQTDLAQQSVEIDADSEMIALIAYLQRLGRGPRPLEAQKAEAMPANTFEEENHANDIAPYRIDEAGVIFDAVGAATPAATTGEPAEERLDTSTTTTNEPAEERLETSKVTTKEPETASSVAQAVAPVGR